MRDPKIPALKKLSYELTQDELNEVVAEEVREHFKPKEKNPFDTPTDKAKLKNFKEISEEAKKKIAQKPPPKPASDYNRSLAKARQKATRAGKEVPQLGEQPQKELDQTPFLSTEEQRIRSFMQGAGITRAQLMEQDNIPVAEAEPARTYVPGEPFLSDDKLKTIGTQMHRFHKWYMKASADGRDTIGAKIRTMDYFTRQDDYVWIPFRDVFDLYQLDALDVSMVTAWVM